MHWTRAILSLIRGTTDRDAFREYRGRLLRWAEEAHGLTRREFASQFEGRYVDGGGRDLFLDYLLSSSKSAPSYVTDHEGMLADREALFRRFGLPILTARELRDKENERLNRMRSPLRI